MSGNKWWKISVVGYGEFVFQGSEEEAEEMRAHKARWEQGIGRKEEISEDHPRVKKEMEKRKGAAA